MLCDCDGERLRLYVYTRSCKFVQSNRLKPISTPEERKQFVLTRLTNGGRVTTAEHAAHFRISEDSSRRDFRELAAEGLIQRVHGAALPVSSATFSFASRRRIAPDTKARLARRAAGLVIPGQVLLFDGGTTNLEIARHLPRTMALTVVTNSPPVALALTDHHQAEIIVLGGVMDRRSQMTLGARVLNAIADVNADLCFLGIHGIDADIGISAAGYDEAMIKRAMIEASSEVAAAAAADKIGAVGAYKIGPSGLVTTLVVDKKAERDLVKDIEKCGTTVVLA